MEKKEFIENYYQRIKSDQVDYFELLGVTQNTILSDIEIKYKALLEKFKSIQLSGDEAPLMEKLQFIIKRINHMFGVISDDEKRERYEKMGNRDINPKELEEPDPVRDARDLFQNGEKSFNNHEYIKAINLFKKAVRLDPQKAIYHYKLGMCQVKVPSFRREAHGNFRKALELEDWNAEYHATMGWLFYLEKFNKKAEPYLRRSLELDNTNQLARKTLNVIAPEGPKGISKFLSKNFPSIYKKKK